MDTIPQKQCFKCKEILPATNEFFYNQRQAKDGLQSYCKICQNSYRPTTKHLAPGSYKRCCGCNELFPATLDYFGPLVRSVDGLYYRCRTCHNKRLRENRHNNSERRREYEREWRANHSEQRRETNRRHIATKPEGYYVEYKRQYARVHREAYATYGRNRRALQKLTNGSHTQQDIQKQLERQKNKCYYCQVKISGMYHVDHVVPLSKGGGNDPSNLVIACPTCNYNKHARLPHEWPEGGRLL